MYNIQTSAITPLVQFSGNWQAVADCGSYSPSSNIYYTAFVVNPETRAVVLFTVDLSNMTSPTTNTIPLSDFFAPITFYQPRNSTKPMLIGYHDWSKSQRTSSHMVVDDTFPTAALVAIDPTTGKTRDLLYFVAPVIVGSLGAFAIDHTNDNLYSLLYRNGAPARWSLALIPLTDPHIAKEWPLSFGETAFISLFPSLP
jgi:hypothetical protein